MTRAWFLLVVVACTETSDASVVLTTANCPSDIALDVPEPYRSLFRCSDLHVVGDRLEISVSGLPPHATFYYPSGDPNHTAWSDRGGAYRPNPNTIAPHPTTISIPLAPVARGLTIGPAQVNGVFDAPTLEYPPGPVGVAIDSVFLFNALAAPGDDIARERFSFDEWNAHPTPDGLYHYHTDTAGPLAVSPPGTEVYGVMCDGTFVLGCTELDGGAPDQGGLDAQNGHVADVGAASARYHVHVCPDWPTHPRPYTPEVQYYRDCIVED